MQEAFEGDCCHLALKADKVLPFCIWYTTDANEMRKTQTGDKNMDNICPEHFVVELVEHD